jgi:ABC-type amino acid transport substrate-binding protein
MTYKYRYWIAAAVGMLLLFMLWIVLWGHKSILPDPVWARIQRGKAVHVGMDASYPPFEVVDAVGNYRGLDVDLAQALAARWGVAVQFTNIPYDGLYDALRVGKVDLIISALPYDRTMTRDVLYSHSYLVGGQVLVARQDNARIGGAQDLAGKTVAVELGSEAHQWLRQYARDKGITIEIQTLRETDAALAAVRDGSADALVCDLVTAYALLKRTPTLRIVGDPLTQELIVIAAGRRSTTLCEQVNAVLDEWQSTGWLEELKGKWF